MKRTGLVSLLLVLVLVPAATVGGVLALGQQSRAHDPARDPAHAIELPVKRVRLYDGDLQRMASDGDTIDYAPNDGEPIVNATEVAVHAQCFDDTGSSSDANLVGDEVDRMEGRFLFDGDEVLQVHFEITCDGVDEWVWERTWSCSSLDWNDDERANISRSAHANPACHVLDGAYTVRLRAQTAGSAAGTGLNQDSTLEFDFTFMVDRYTLDDR